LRMALTFAPLSVTATWFASARWGAMGALIAFLSSQVALRSYASVYQQRHLATRYSKMLPVKEMALLTGWVLLLSSMSLALRPVFQDERMWFLGAGLMF